MQVKHGGKIYDAVLYIHNFRCINKDSFEYEYSDDGKTMKSRTLSSSITPSLEINFMFACNRASNYNRPSFLVEQNLITQKNNDTWLYVPQSSISTRDVREKFENNFKK